MPRRTSKSALEQGPDSDRPRHSQASGDDGFTVSREERTRKLRPVEEISPDSLHRTPAMTASMHDVFGPGGLLERCMIGGYEHRPGQLEMAEVVHDAFEQHHHAVVEAGTGTGKTLAYLIPAICSGRRVVISTATKSLQEQLYQKDVPFLQKHFAPNLKVAVMKGRSNFLCHARVHQMADQPLLKGMEEIDAFRQIREWSTADRNRRPQRAHLPLRRFRSVDQARRPPGHLHRAEVRPLQQMFCHRHAPACQGSRSHHRQPSFVFRRSVPQTG